MVGKKARKNFECSWSKFLLVWIFVTTNSSTVTAFIPSTDRIHIQELRKVNRPIHQKKVIQNVNLPTKSESTRLSSLPSGFLASSATSKATSILAGISSPLVSVTTLAFVVLVHEAGHFIAARSMNIDVEEFSVGVGPKLLGFTTNQKIESESAKTVNEVLYKAKNKGLENLTEKSIDFSLRAIPLGGYVRFPENYNRTEVMRLEYEELQNREREKEMLQKQNQKGNKKKFQPLIAFTNTFRSKQAKEEQKERELRLKLAEEREKKKWWKLGFNQDKKVNTSTKTKPKKIEIDYFQDPNLLQNRPWNQRAIVLVGGIVFNLLLAFSIYFGEVTVGKGIPTPIYEPGAVVRLVSSKAENSASYGILNVGDTIVGINGHPMTLSKASTSVAQGEISNLISTIRSTVPGESVSFSVLPSKSNIPKEVSIIPRAPMNPSTGEYLSPPTIGVTLIPNYIETKLIRANSISDAFRLAGTALTDITTDTAASISKALYSMIFSSSESNQLSGPIGVIRMGSDVASSSNYDVGAIAAFAAAISVNLAVVNALPLPVLDGGQLVFVLLEGLAGRKVVEQDLEEKINAYVLFLILFISVSTALGDIGSILGK